MLLLLSFPAAADVPDWSVVPLRSVLPDEREVSAEAPVRAAVTGVVVSVVPGSESRLRLTYTLQTFTDGYAVADLGAGELTQEDALLNGRFVAVAPDARGRRMMAASLPRGTHTLTLTGVMTTPTRQLTLSMPDAPVELVVSAPGGAELAITAEGAAAISPGRFIMPPGPALKVGWREAGPPAPRPDRLEAVAAVGLTVSSDGIEGAGLVTFDAVHGAVSTVRIAVPGADWAEATGSVVSESRRVGDWLEIGLVAAQTGRFSIDVALRGPAGESLTQAPLLLPEADRREGWVSLYQGEDGFISRQRADLEIISPTTVPEWGRDLASGRLLSSLHYTTGQPSLRWQASEWESVETPGTVVDTAQYEVAVVAHGRALTRARYQVRNDRGAWLWMALPPESTVLSVRMAGNIVEPVRSGDRLGVPLEKSVETFTGLVSFPVEVSYLSAAPVFSRRGRAELTTPALSAPVADARWTVYLPPEVTSRRAEGNVQQAVEPTGQTLDIGRGYGRKGETEAYEWSTVTATGSVSQVAEDSSQELWNQAYDAYKDNRFDEAGELLEQSLIYNPGNSAASALSSNVAVLTGESTEEVDAEQAERVRAMARAKSSREVQQQEDLVSSADEQLWAGNVEEAISLYESAIEVSGQLANLESDDDYVQKAVVDDLKVRLQEAQATSSRNKRQLSELERSILVEEVLVEEEWEEEEWEADERVVISSDQILLLEPGAHEADLRNLIPASSGGGEDAPVMAFDDANIDGALMTPDGASLNGFSGDYWHDEAPEPVMVAEPEAPPPPPPAPPADQGAVLSRDFLQNVPTGRSYQSAVEMAAGVTGGSNPNTGGASANENSYDLYDEDDVDGDFAADMPASASTMVMVDESRSSRRGGRLGGRLGGADAKSSPARDPAPAAGPPVQTTSAFAIPQGVTASRWIVLVPESGPVLKFSRQLVPAEEGLAVEVRYRRARSGRQGG